VHHQLDQEGAQDAEAGSLRAQTELQSRLEPVRIGRRDWSIIT
jgi:hypothetical protein